jgi:hypothetical protein
MYNAAMRRAQTLGGAFDTAVNTMYERQEENKAFNSKLKALEAMVQTHSTKFGMAPDQVKQFLAVNPSESPKERYLRIGGFLEGSIKAAELQAKQAEIDSQNKLRDAQIGQFLAETAKTQEETARRAALAKFYGLDAGRPAAAAPAVSAGAAPAEMPPAAPMPTAQAVAPVTPEQPAMPAPSMAAAGREPMPALGGPAPAATPPQLSGPMQAAATNAAKFTVSPDLQGFTPDVARAAENEARLEFLSTGKMANRTLIAQRIASERRKLAGEEREMTLDEGNDLQEKFNAAEREKPIGVRRQMVIRSSNRPGYVAPEIVMAEPSPLEKSAMEAKNVGDKLRLERISATITEDKKAAAGDRLYAPAVGKLQSLIAEDKIEGGALADLKTNVMSFGRALGINVNESELADLQQARSYFGQILIPLFINTKGATSDRDATLFASWNPQLALNNKANAEMLKVIQARIKLNRALEELGSKIDAEEITDKQYITQRSKLLREYDDAIPDVDSFLSSVGAPPRNIAQNLGPAAVSPQVTQATVDRNVAQGGSAAAGLFEKLKRDAEARKGAR